MADWQKIKTEYITTDTSYRKLAEKYGMSYRAVADKGNSEQWVELRNQYQIKTTSEIVEAVSKQEVSRAEKLQRAADILLGKVVALVEASDPMEMDTQSMKHISGVLKDIKEIQMIRSEADMLEQEARIANLRKQAEKEDDHIRDVTITIEGGDPSWQS